MFAYSNSNCRDTSNTIRRHSCYRSLLAVDPRVEHFGLENLGDVKCLFRLQLAFYMKEVEERIQKHILHVDFRVNSATQERFEALNFENFETFKACNFAGSNAIELKSVLSCLPTQTLSPCTLRTGSADIHVTGHFWLSIPGSTILA